MDAITNGATIEIVATGERFHTLNDWGLAIGNNDYIGDVEQENYYVDVPGADAFWISQKPLQAAAYSKTVRSASSWAVRNQETTGIFLFQTLETL